MPARWDTAAFERAMRRLPGQLHDNVARGAVRAFAQPVLEDAQRRCHSKDVAATLEVKTRLDGDAAVATIGSYGKGSFKAPWLEYGTDRHLIVVDRDEGTGRFKQAGPVDLGGKSLKRINRLNRDAERQGSLRIGGNFVGPVVDHPGAEEQPFLRPALLTQMENGRAGAIAYLATRFRTGDFDRPAPTDEDQA